MANCLTRVVVYTCFFLAIFSYARADNSGHGKDTATFQSAQEAFERGDYVTALKLCRPLALHGMSKAQTLLGRMYNNGLGTPTDQKLAFDWFYKAAKNGDADGQYLLGQMYTYGHGTKANHVEALKWYKTSVKNGNVSALYSVGEAYLKGKGVPKNPTEALKWYRKSAEKGTAQNKSILGMILSYDGGYHGIPNDYHEAFKWYLLAAELGCITSQWHVGDFYDRGLGVLQDYKLAIKWYNTAIENWQTGDIVPYGAVAAMHSLGLAYLRGHGVTQDLVKAHMWFNLAAATDRGGIISPVYRQSRDDVAKQMTTTQVTEAQQLAREWMEKHKINH